MNKKVTDLTFTRILCLVPPGGDNISTLLMGASSCSINLAITKINRVSPQSYNNSCFSTPTPMVPSTS